MASQYMPRDLEQEVSHWLAGQNKMAVGFHLFSGPPVWLMHVDVEPGNWEHVQVRRRSGGYDITRDAQPSWCRRCGPE